MAELLIKIKGNSKEAQAALKKAGVSFEKFDGKTKKSTFGLGQFKMGALAAVGAIVAATAAINKFVQAAATQQKAQVTLAAAMQQAGTFTEEAFRHNLKYAQSLQKMTTFGDEAILGVQKMLTNFGVEGEMLDQLTKSTLDLAAAKGMDLKAAADLVAKSVGSSTNALTRYGIEVKGAAGSTDRMQTAVENITKLFGGAAAAEADTFEGQMKQIKNTMGDVSETIGFEFIKAINPAIKKFKEFIESSEGVKLINKLILGLQLVINLVVNSIKLLVARFKLIATVGKAAFTIVKFAIESLIEKFEPLKKAIEATVGFFQKAKDKIVETFSEGADAAGGLINKIESPELKQALLDVGAAFKDAGGTVKDSYATLYQDLQNLFTDSKTAQEEDLDELVQKYVEGAQTVELSWRETFRKNVQNANKWLQSNIKIIKSFSSAFTKISSGLVQIEQNRLDKIDAADTEAREKQAKRIRNLMIFEKATKIAAAGIDSAAAILKTMASVPYPFNIPLAVAQGVAGAVQVGVIASTPIPSVADLAAPHGADFVTDGPTTMTVGDNPSGKERITVTPEEEETGGTGNNIFYIDNLVIQTDSPEEFGQQMQELAVRTARRA